MSAAASESCAQADANWTVRPSDGRISESHRRSALTLGNLLPLLRNSAQPEPSVTLMSLIVSPGSTVPAPLQLCVPVDGACGAWNRRGFQIRGEFRKFSGFGEVTCGTQAALEPRNGSEFENSVCKQP